MQVVTLDYETYWSATHDIKKCGGPIRYLQHKDTEIQSCAIKVDNNPTDVVFGDEIAYHHKHFDWSNSIAVAHNMSGFDAMILAWKFRVKPKAYGCTLAMARPIFSKTCGNTLKAVSHVLGIGEKLSLEATNTKGKRLAEFTPEEIVMMTEYNKVDTDLCYDVFQKLIPFYSMKELKTIDYSIRMLVEPKFETDIILLEETLVKIKAEKLIVLDNIADNFGIVGDDRHESVRALLASAPKFAKVLESMGVEVPMKVSKTTGKQIPAIAKSDQPLLDMLEHPDEKVQAVVAARLSVKSTLLETRMEAFIANTERGRLPMPLHYCGADTTGRWSGFLYNPQNLPRINPSKPKSSDALRYALKAPKGYKVIVADQSGIELRVNHFLWKVESSMDLYKEDALADLYKSFAATMYNIPVEEVSKDQRQLAKMAQLGLGFQSGAITFQRIAKMMGGIDISLEEAKKVVNDWRGTYHAIVQGWKECSSSIKSIYTGDVHPIDPWGFCLTEKGAIRLPSGRKIYYPALRTEQGDTYKEWRYGEGRHKASLSGGKMTENMVQAISRDIINDNVIDYMKLTGRKPSLLVHDEAVYVVKEAEAEQALADLQGIMRISPKWWPEIILWSEGDIADTYGAAK